MNPQKDSVTVAVLSNKLDTLFGNVKDIVKSTARGTENVLNKRIDGVEQQLGELRSDVSILKSDVKEIKITVKHLDEKFSEKINDHETRITTLETARI